MVGPDPSYSPSRSTSAGKCEKKQDRPSNPHRVLTLWWSNHFDLHRGCRQLRRILCHALTSLLEHGGATWQHDKNLQIHADVNVALPECEKKCRGLRWLLCPMKLVGKTHAQRKRSALTVKMFPCEGRWVCFLTKLSVVDLSSVSQTEAM